MNNQEKVWKVAKWVGVLLAIFLAVISIKELTSIQYVGKDTPIMNLITVNGKGESVSIPDIATFSFSVTENAKTVGDAQGKSSTKINSVLKAIKGAGILDKDIKTISYNINPHYDYVPVPCSTNIMCGQTKSVLSGYDVSQTIQVKIRNLDKAGSILDTVGGLGVQDVNGLTFGIDDIDTVKAAARNTAIENAKEKAKTLAKNLGVKLVRITSFYDQSDDMYPIYAAESMSAGYGMKSAMAPAPTTDIPSGEQKVTAKVSITYEIR